MKIIAALALMLCLVGCRNPHEDPNPCPPADNKDVRVTGNNNVTVNGCGNTVESK